MKSNNNVGKNIKRLRVQAGLTQSELANLMGYKSKSTVNKVELGVNEPPQSAIAKYAKIFNTTPSELMGWDSQGLEELTQIYNELSLEGKDKLIDYAKDLKKIYPKE